MLTPNKTTITEWIDGLTLSEKADPRKEIMLFPYGEFEHRTYGKLNFNDEFFDEIIRNYQNNVLGTKPFLDEQHDENKALGWFNTSPYKRPFQGLFIKPDYTALGNKLLKEKLYKYFSPSWGSYEDPQTGTKWDNVLMGGAATNIPFLKTMPPIVDETRIGSDKEMVKMMLSDLIINSSSDAGGVADDSKSGQKQKIIENKGEKIMKDKLIKMFSLSEDASEDSIIEKINEVITSNADLVKEVADIKSKIEKESKKEASEKNATVKELTEKLDVTTKNLSDVSTKLITRDKDTAIEKALKEGKITAADKEYWETRYMSDPDNVGKDLEKLPKSIDFSELGSSGEGEKKSLSNDPGQKMVDEAKKLMIEKKANSFDEAIAKVCSDDPKLAESYRKKYVA